MKPRFSPLVFALAYCVAYVIALSMDAALFKYYPRSGTFSWGWVSLQGNGPGMAWYGVMASAAIAALPVAAILPEQKLAGALRNSLWLFPLFAMGGTVYLMSHFFFR